MNWFSKLDWMMTYSDGLLFRVLLGISMIWICSMAFSTGFAETAIHVAYSANINGYLEPCGCAGPDEEMLGGLQKRATLIKAFREENGSLLIVDSGDLFFGESSFKESLIPSVQLKADTIAKILVDTGIHAINVGELDLALGLKFLKKLEKEYRLPLVSANLVDASQTHLFKRYVIVELDGVKIGIFGIMGDSKKLQTALKTCAGQEIQIQNTLEATTSVVNELKTKVDFIVALTHQHMGRNWVVARRVPGIDLVVGGHHTQRVKVPYRAENTFIVQSGEKGNYLGLVHLKIDGQNRSADNKLVALGDSVAKDARSEKMISQYNEDITKLYVAVANKQNGSVDRRAKGCAECHEKEYQIWEESAHAHAFATLEEKSRQFDPECVACHTTLFEQPGGYTMRDQPVSMRDVQCEVCHGDGSAHSANELEPLPLTPDKMACFECHTTTRSPGFKENYHQKWSEIDH